MASAVGQDAMLTDMIAEDTETANAPTEPTSASAMGDADLELGNSNVLDRIRTNLSTAFDDFGARPECFKNTLQEVSFVAEATLATATTSFLTGVSVIVTATIGRDLGMTQSEISWITASTSYGFSVERTLEQLLTD
jgi:hypothetical protein